MVSSPPDRLTVETFELTISDINDIDLEQLHALSIAVGWPHRGEDWQFLREFGKGIVALDDIGRAMGSAMWFDHGTGIATIGMVITSPRLQANGAGHWLMQHVMQRCKSQNLRLSATRDARRLYMSLDFCTQQKVFQCQGEARLPGEALELGDDFILRVMEPSDQAAAIALDALAFGVSRAKLIEKLWDQSQGYGLFRQGRLIAFSLCRRFGRGYVVGPVVAGNDDEAIAVVHPHVEAHAGDFLRLDTVRGSGAFSAFLSRSGLAIFDTVTAMSLPQPESDESRADGETMATYALVSQALC